MDDIFIVLQLWRPSEKYSDMAEKECGLLCASLLKLYSDHFGLKEEDAHIFVGLRTQFDGVELKFAPSSKLSFTNAVFEFSSARLQHWLSASLNTKKIQVVQGLLVMCADLCSDEESLIRAATCLLSELRLVGYPWEQLQSAVVTVLKTQPYLELEFQKMVTRSLLLNNMQSFSKSSSSSAR